MAYIAQHTAPFGAVNEIRSVSFFSSLVQAVVSWNDARKTRNALSELTKAQLEDIGLTEYHIEIQ
ncbi:DUF1127 domain-containing protein [Epibacterium ulvae]|uniref:Uncharacterized conserved protein YjiS, DUF1127 family n=1 Tax=Epibacterium ulvae TaxID=1156985 RepID=A0A1G5REN8_9RHOB|nr:DUF1127 domain-containing protein [Epibacterium ulvae]SCZ72456.1 Uncharacterized conserved protein YjiS, DUF1127 family [Epibacterium ulvae]